MNRIILALIALFAIARPMAALTYDELAVKADRFYRHAEWPSALAMMHLMLDERPADIDVRARAITASSLMGDTVAQIAMTRAAIDLHIPFDSLFSHVETAMLAQGSAPLYAAYLERVAVAEPWLSRSIDSYLLRFYNFRQNPAGMITYSRKMLAGMPDNVDFLHILANGYMLDGRMDQAVTTLDRILELAPDDTDALLNLGNYYLLIGNREKALPYLRRACEIHPTPYLRSIIGNSGPVSQ